MRVSTANRFDASIAQLQKRQQELADTNQRLVSGKRVNRASDDPAAAARSERMQALQVRNDATLRGVSASRVAMSLADTALGDATDLLQQVRETLIQAGNPTLDTVSRQALATQLGELRGQLLAVANSADGNGGYVFGGQGSASPPFRETPTGVRFDGMSGQNNISASELLPTTLDGAAAWLQARTGNGVFETRILASGGSAVIDTGSVVDPGQLTGSTYELQFSVMPGQTLYSIVKDGNPTPVTNVPYESGKSIAIDGIAVTVSGQPANGDRFEMRPAASDLSIFDVMDRTIATLSDPSASESAVTQASRFGLRDVDSSMSQLLTARAQVGGVLNRLDTRESQLGSENLAARTTQSDAEDLDMIEAISNFQNQQTGLQAALQSYAMVQGMTLMQFLRN